MQDIIVPTLYIDSCELETSLVTEQPVDKPGLCQENRAFSKIEIIGNKCSVSSSRYS